MVGLAVRSCRVFEGQVRRDVEGLLFVQVNLALQRLSERMVIRILVEFVWIPILRLKVSLRAQIDLIYLVFSCLMKNWIGCYFFGR